MPVIVDPPKFRRAGSLGLLDEDLVALRAFRPYVGAGSWYEREASRVVRRAAGLLSQGELRERDGILMFEWDDELLAVTVFSEESSRTAHLGFVGLKAEVHGARIDDVAGPRLSDAVLDATLDEIASLGYDRVTAQVARDHARSRALVARAGFTAVSRYDSDYDLVAVAV